MSFDEEAFFGRIDGQKKFADDHRNRWGQPPRFNSLQGKGVFLLPGESTMPPVLVPCVAEWEAMAEAEGQYRRGGNRTDLELEDLRVFWGQMVAAHAITIVRPAKDWRYWYQCNIYFRHDEPHARLVPPTACDIRQKMRCPIPPQPDGSGDHGFAKYAARIRSEFGL